MSTIRFQVCFFVLFALLSASLHGCAVDVDLVGNSNDCVLQTAKSKRLKDSSNTSKSLVPSSVPKSGSASSVKHVDHSNHSNGVFDNTKMDIYNRHIADIKYEIRKTPSSFVAVGEKWIVQQSFRDGAKSNSIDEILNRTVRKNQKNSVSFGEPFQLDPKNVSVIESDNVLLTPTSFDNLKKWNHDNFDDALESFLNSCKVFLTYKKRLREVETAEMQFGSIDEWNKICLKAVDFARQDMAKEFFEIYFTPFLVRDKKYSAYVGKFTGYCEFSTLGSLSKTSRYKYPVYRKPGTCTSSAKCPTRRQIYDGALAKKGYEICWIDNPLDLYKLQIQGSGIVILGNNSFIRLSYGGTNQHKQANINVFDKVNYAKLLPPGNRTHANMVKLMKSNPKIANTILSKNPSYTFFVHNNSRFANGSHSALTPSRSIAIDPRYIPYGMPMWIQTSLPVKSIRNSSKWIPLNRLTIAQDTGVAIKGVVRADIFFGHGDKAIFLSHHLRFNGSYYMLIPNSVIGKIRIKKVHKK